MTTAMVDARPRTMRGMLTRLLTEGPGAPPQAKPLNLSHSYELRAGQIRVLINPERERQLSASLRAAQEKHDKLVAQAMDGRARAKAAAKAAYDKAMEDATIESNKAIAKARDEFEATEQELLRQYSLPPVHPAPTPRATTP